MLPSFPRFRKGLKFLGIRLSLPLKPLWRKGSSRGKTLCLVLPRAARKEFGPTNDSAPDTQGVRLFDAECCANRRRRGNPLKTKAKRGRWVTALRSQSPQRSSFEFVAFCFDSVYGQKKEGDENKISSPSYYSCAFRTRTKGSFSLHGTTRYRSCTRVRGPGPISRFRRT